MIDHPDCHSDVTPEIKAGYVARCVVCQERALRAIQAAPPPEKYFDMGGTDATWEEQQKAADAHRSALIAHDQAVRQHAALLQQLQMQQSLAVNQPRLQRQLFGVGQGSGLGNWLGGLFG
jgi:hypothetical protein